MDLNTLLRWILLVCTCCSLTCKGALQGEVFNESEVIKLLTKDYVKEARPVVNVEDAVNVSLAMSFVGIEDLNQDEMTFKATILLSQIWKDPRLTWDAKNYGGMKSVVMPTAKIWTPDLVLYNGANADDGLSNDERAIVAYDGTVFWVPMLVLSSKCPMDFTHFPYDIQTCQIFLGSWMYASSQMAIKFYDPVTKDKSEVEVVKTEEAASFPVSEHPRWTLVDNKAKASIQNKKFSCCHDLFSIITISCQMTRKPTFFRYLLIGPAAVLGFLVPLLFLLPSRTQEKSTFGMLLLMSTVFLIILLQDELPMTVGSVPKIGLFYLATMVLTSLSIILSVIISNMSVRGSRRRSLPAWLHKTFLSRNCLRRILCIDRYSPVDNLFAESMRQVDDATEAGPEPELPGREMDTGNKMESQLRDICRYLRYICGKVSADDTYKNVNQDWEEVARVLDRILFVLFFVFYALTAVSLLT